MKPIQLISVALLTLLLGGCSLAPKYERPDEALPSTLGSSVTPAGPWTAETLNAWWLQVEDPVLHQLIERAQSQHPGVYQGLASIAQARASLDGAKAESWPSLTGTAQGSRSEGAGFQLAQGQSNPANLFQVMSLLTYELDLLGKVANARSAAQLELEASEYALAATRSLLAAETAALYFDLVHTHESIRLTEKHIETLRRTLEIRENRLAVGYGAESDQQISAAQLASIQAILPSLQLKREVLETGLRVLCGHDAATIWSGGAIAGAATLLPACPELRWEIAPVALLARRPDVQSAEARLQAACARIGVVRAQRWPSLSISAILGTADHAVDDLFTEFSRTWTLGATLAGPIYDFGRSGSRIRSAEAQYELAQWNYRMVVREALAELRVAATRHETNTQVMDAQQRQLVAWSKALDSAVSRDREGFSDPLELLEIQRGYYAAATSKLQASREGLGAWIDLARALGGGWQAADGPSVL